MIYSNNKQVNTAEEWSPSKPGKAAIYTRFPWRGTPVRPASQFKYTAAHEFGHTLGLIDAREGSPSNDIMNWAKLGWDIQYQVLSENMREAIKAFQTKTIQEREW